MTNLDVVPVGRPAGASTVRRRGWVRVVVGIALLVAGIAVAVVGILDAVGSHGQIEGDAIARGTITETAQPVTFDVPDGGKRDYTVYVIFPKGNFVNRELEEDAAVRTTECRATRPDGDTHTFRGSRQGISETIGRASTIGYFTSVPGRVRLHCAYTAGSLRSERRRFDSVPYVVTPGKPSGGATLLIVAGVFGAIGGGFLAGWGLLGKRRPI